MFHKICMSKRKNLDPWGGGEHAPAASPPPPGSANAMSPMNIKLWSYMKIKKYFSLKELKNSTYVKVPKEGVLYLDECYTMICIGGVEYGTMKSMGFAI